MYTRQTFYYSTLFLFSLIYSSISIINCQPIAVSDRKHIEPLNRTSIQPVVSPVGLDIQTNGQHINIGLNLNVNINVKYPQPRVIDQSTAIG